MNQRVIPHDHEILQFWESEATKPKVEGVSHEANDALERAYRYDFPSYLQKPFQPLAQIRAAQFARIQQLVDIAFTSIPVYREKYKAAGFSRGGLQSWRDFESLPTITKDELIVAFPEGCVNPRWPIE